MSYKNMIVTENGETCFSRRALPTCSAGYDTTATVEKSEPFYCTSVKANVDHFTKMVQKGARPDFSKQKQIKHILVRVAVKCALNPRA
jgi:hypothetical protein